MVIVAVARPCLGDRGGRPERPGSPGSKSDTVPCKYEYPTNWTAAIYAPGTKNLLFRFRRLATRSGATVSVHRDFADPAGNLAAMEDVFYQGDQLVRYDLKELQIGAEGSARIRASPTDPAKGTLEFEYRPGPNSRLKTSTEALVPDTLIGDMIGPFLGSHWQAIQRGEKVRCRYIVVPRLETVGFTFAKEAKGANAAGLRTVLVRQLSRRITRSRRSFPVWAGLRTSA